MHEDHPRGCGENVTAFDGQPLELGITPADAGKTSGRTVGGLSCWDHPRGCGENALGIWLHTCMTGSPPRMRGKPAGQPCMCAVCKDHPRGCGENVFIRVKRAERNGSPPRMRGKHGFGDVWVRIPRITPADAGKTQRRLAVNMA